MGTARVVILTNQSPEFYTLMGPFLSRREIVKELGAPVWDEDGKTWFISVTNKQVNGFGAVVISKKGAARLCSFWVRPKMRRRGIHSKLLVDALGWLRSVESEVKVVQAVCTQDAVANYTRAGFSETGRRGNYTTMEREI